MEFSATSHNDRSLVLKFCTYPGTLVFRPRVQSPGSCSSDNKFKHRTAITNEKIQGTTTGSCTWRELDSTRRVRKAWVFNHTGQVSSLVAQRGSSAQGQTTSTFRCTRKSSPSLFWTRHLCLYPSDKGSLSPNIRMVTACR